LETVAKNKLYEGMFLVDSAQAGADWDGVISAIRTILEKAEAEIVSIKKWDDRKLAYEINGKTRGTYILCYFRANGEKIGDIEKAVRLSEKIMRALILSAEQQGVEDIERGPISQKDSEMGTQKDTPATKMGKEKEKRKANEEATQKAEAERGGAGEEVEDLQESEQSVVADDSIDKQPEQYQIEDSEYRNAGNGQG